ncbi:acyltransferase family protein [Mesorhizobium sp. AR07]|uniref:acyltransferase family protein n=1 Tax=Mesorhizobium sp. AR07 TaxID=2865838 RepID=UPI00215DFC3A|nr:acyltransferase family protein [Mesorhizobium sp. AR07]UVK41874.1 acyltransferase family protein [Mesorhizobium sp. AR07]
MSSPASSAYPHRELFIDHLRALVVLALILFHSARLFDSEDWHIKNAQTFIAADVLVAVFNIVGMPLLFLLAGMSAYASLGARSARRFLSERFQRLFVPLLLGMIIVVPPQVYVERISPLVALRTSPVDFSGSFLAFYPSFFTSCCYPHGNFSWHHLWFLAYLFVFSILLLPPLLLLRWTMQRQRILLSPVAGSAVLAALGLPLLLIELTLRPSFPSTHALIDDWANNFHYMWLLLAGAFAMACPNLTVAARCHRRTWVLAGAILSAGWLALRFGMMPFVPPLGTGLALRTVAEWTCLVALIGYGSAYLWRPLPFLTRFGAIAMPFYIVHQTVIVLIGFWLLGWVDAPFLKYATVATLSFATSLAIAAIAARSAVLRLVFGLKVGRQNGRGGIAAASAPTS